MRCITFALALCTGAALCTACGERGSASRASDTAIGARAGDAGATGASAGAGSRGSVPMRLSVTTSGGSVAASNAAMAGVGECGHEPNASIYDRPAAMWTAAYDGAASAPLKSLHLTVWRPKDGSPDEFSLSTTGGSGRGSASHQISTVKGGQLAGSGTVTMQTRGAGARFEVDGQAADGARIRATVECERLTRIEAEGG